MPAKGASPAQPRLLRPMTRRGSMILLKQQAEALATSEEEDNKCKGCFKRVIIKTEILMNSMGVQIVIFAATLFVLFGSDVFTLTFSSEADPILQTVNIFALILFSVEMIVKSLIYERYRWSLFFWLDFVATGSLLFDISAFTQLMYSFDGESDTGALSNSLSLTRASRAAAAGARLPRLMRLLRVFRLMRVAKLLKMFNMAHDQSIEGGAMEMHEDGKDKLKEGVSGGDRTDPTKKSFGLGQMQILGDRVALDIAMKVVLGGLALVLIVPLLEAELPLDYSINYGLRELELLTNTSGFADGLANFKRWNPAVVELSVLGQELIAPDLNKMDADLVSVVSESERSFAVEDISAYVQSEAIFSIIRTCAIVIILGFQSGFLVHVIHKNLVIPLEGMVDCIGRTLNLEVLQKVEANFTWGRSNRWQDKGKKTMEENELAPTSRRLTAKVHLKKLWDGVRRRRSDEAPLIEEDSNDLFGKPKLKRRNSRHWWHLPKGSAPEAANEIGLITVAFQSVLKANEYLKDDKHKRNARMTSQNKQILDLETPVHCLVRTIKELLENIYLTPGLRMDLEGLLMVINSEKDLRQPSLGLEKYHGEELEWVRCRLLVKDFIIPHDPKVVQHRSFPPKRRSLFDVNEVDEPKVVEKLSMADAALKGHRASLSNLPVTSSGELEALVAKVCLLDVETLVEIKGDMLKEGWELDMFDIDKRSKGHSLLVTASVIFERHFIFELLKLPRAAFVSYFAHIEALSSTNPFHNRVRAAAVAWAASELLANCNAKNVLTPLDIFALLLSGLVRCAGHPGHSPAFARATRTPMGLRYPSELAVELHVLATALGCSEQLTLSALFAALSPTDFETMRATVSALMVGRHPRELLGLLADMQDIDMNEANTDGIPAKLLLRAISSIADTFDFSCNNAVHNKWAELRLHEYFREGDVVRAQHLGKPPPFSNRHAPRTASAMLLQLQFIARPVLLQFARLVDDRKFTNVFVRYLHENRTYWMEQQKVEDMAPVFLDDPCVPGLVERSICDLSSILPTPTITTTTTTTTAAIIDTATIATTSPSPDAEVICDFLTTVTTTSSTTSPIIDVIAKGLHMATTAPTAAVEIFDNRAIFNEIERSRARLSEWVQAAARVEAHRSPRAAMVEAQRDDGSQRDPSIDHSFASNIHVKPSLSFRNELHEPGTFGRPPGAARRLFQTTSMPACKSASSNSSDAISPFPATTETPLFIDISESPPRPHHRRAATTGGMDQTISIHTSPNNKVVVRIPSSLTASLSPRKNTSSKSSSTAFNFTSELWNNTASS